MGVYFDDLDPMHILHNSRYLLLFERTMGSFWQHLGLSEFQIAIEEMGSGRAELKPLVTHRVSLDDIQSGFETSYDKTTGAIKVQVLTA